MESLGESLVGRPPDGRERNRVHKRLHAAKIAMGHKGGDPIIPVARDLASQATILCFDEFQVIIRVS